MIVAAPWSIAPWSALSAEAPPARAVLRAAPLWQLLARPPTALKIARAQPARGVGPHSASLTLAVRTLSGPRFGAQGRRCRRRVSRLDAGRYIGTIRDARARSPGRLAERLRERGWELTQIDEPSRASHHFRLDGKRGFSRQNVRDLREF